MASNFFAMISRLKYIDRWALMRNTHEENLSEHCMETACIAHALAVIGNRRFGKYYNAERAALLGLYHDAPETLTGDMPTPVKYKNDALRTAYKDVERESARVMASLLPAELQSEVERYLTGAVLSNTERRLLKAADRLSALIKCIEEGEGGNREFAAARAQQLAALHEMQCPEAEYFIEHMLPCYTQNLDELTRGRF